MTEALFDRERLKPRLAALARAGVFIGTSSWKYPGWFGQVYDRQRYIWRGRYVESRFERLCLAEYGQLFHTVCVDAAYYQFPGAALLSAMAGQVPADFQFAFKVTDRITVKRFPNLPRFGARAGTANPDFLNAELFTSAFLRPCEAIRSKVGLLIFEFSRFWPSDFKRGREFVAALDEFLERLPGGWPYGVEIRNRSFLQPEYFAVLARRGVAHVFNSWEAMPPLAEQLALPGSLTRPDLAAVRLLLQPGRRYADAVKLFAPYDRLKEPQPAIRAAAAGMIRAAQQSGRPQRLFLFVNNRFEGNAPGTIAAILEEASLMG